MVAAEKIKAGVTRYLDNEILPRMPAFKAVAFGTAAALYLRRLPEICSQIPASMGITNDSGMIDLDAIREELRGRMNQPVDIDVPMIGRLTIDRDEIDKIYRYIMEA